MSGAYYNEIDEYAAEWLRNLIKAGHIAAGDVDTRSIEDVHPADLKGYTQCHFFAGIGVWSYALRRAGWDDSRPVWTGSCPCQPFSAAGKGAGFSDERHLWPAWFHLIEQHRPAAILGEQVASKDADPWIDLVHADMEALGYAFGAVPFPSAGIGAPHIRDRLYWVADANEGRRGRRASDGECVGDRTAAGWKQDAGHAARRRTIRRLANADSAGRISRSEGREAMGYRAPAESDRSLGGLDNADHQGLEGLGRGHQAAGGRIATLRPAAATGESGGVAHGARDGWREQRADIVRSDERGGAQELGQRLGRGGILGSDGPAGPTNGHWRDADWLGCRDGKWRPVEPGTFPLAHGAASRVGRLRAYGNAINAEAAAEMISAYMASIAMPAELIRVAA